MSATVRRGGAPALATIAGMAGLPLDLTVAIAGIALWLGLGLLFVGLMGPLVVGNPAHRRTFASLIAVGGVMVVVSVVVLLVGAFGFVNRSGHAG